LGFYFCNYLLKLSCYYDSTLTVNFVTLQSFNFQLTKMCFYYQLSAKAQELESRFNKSFPKNAAFQKKDFINAFEFPTLPIILKNEDTFVFYNWGLIPHWAKDDSIKKYTLNLSST